MFKLEAALVPVAARYLLGEHVLVDRQIGGLRRLRLFGGERGNQCFGMFEAAEGARHAHAAGPAYIHVHAPVGQPSPQQGPPVVLPRVAQADIGGGDAQHVHMRYLRQRSGGIHPGTAVHAEGKAHVVRVVVQHHQLERDARVQALQQWQAEMVEVAAAEHHRAELCRQRPKNFSGEA
ncbi:hypothetical protein D3C73_1096090 [compost metagenome]